MIEKRKPLKYLDDTSGAPFSLDLRYEVLSLTGEYMLLFVHDDDKNAA